MRTVIQILLSLVIIFLGYNVFESIMKPIRFNKEKDIRERAAIAKLIDIREAQKAFKDKNLRYTSDFDSLVNFVKQDSFIVTRAIGEIPESLIDSLQDINKARAIAMKRGIIRREESKVAVIDSVFGKNFNAFQLGKIMNAGRNKMRCFVFNRTHHSAVIFCADQLIQTRHTGHRYKF